MSTARLSALTDGVFAIVMTLLVFDLRVPLNADALTEELARLLPNLVAFALSFVILGVYWVAHHGQFQFIQRVDNSLLWLNILFLMMISLVPFSAGMLGRHGSQPVAVILYGANLIGVAAAHLSTWRYATKNRRLTAPDLDPAVVRLGVRLSVIPMLIYPIAMIAAFISPVISLALYMLVPLPYVFGWLYRG